MTDHSSIVTGMAAGVGGAILALLGVDAPTLTAALIGCVIGAGAAKPTGRVHGVCLFVAAVCASAESAAIFGPILDHATDGMLPWLDAAKAAKFVAMVTGVVLHPLTQAALDATPAVIAGLARLIPHGKE